jgi:nucleotide-binding universal stress UspA family protein
VLALQLRSFSPVKLATTVALPGGTCGEAQGGNLRIAIVCRPRGGDAMLPINNILFPTDFSERAKNAFHMASALARDHRAALTVLHVREMPALPFGEFGAVPPVDLPTREELIEKLSQFEPEDESINVEFVIADGEPGEEIVRLAQERHCDLIVMGTHGRTGLSRLLMGSVAERVVRKAPCPVLTLKAPVPVVETVPAPAAAASV